MKRQTQIAFTWLYCFAAAQLAVASSPNNPLGLTIDGSSKSVSLNPSQAEAWFAVSGDLHETSHLILETAGSADPELALYRNLQDALADSPLEEDRDSGPNANARIERFVGYRLPWFVRIRLENPLDTGTVSVSVTSEFRPPERCSSGGPCTFSVASSGKPGGRDLLATMRGVRTFLLQQTRPGSELIDLYYDISKDLLPHVLFDSNLRGTLFRLGSQLTPGCVQRVRLPASCPLTPVSQSIGAAQHMRARAYVLPGL